MSLWAMARPPAASNTSHHWAQFFPVAFITASSPTFRSGWSGAVGGCFGGIVRSPETIAAAGFGAGCRAGEALGLERAAFGLAALTDEAFLPTFAGGAFLAEVDAPLRTGAEGAFRTDLAAFPFAAFGFIDFVFAAALPLADAFRAFFAADDLSPRGGDLAGGLVFFLAAAMDPSRGRLRLRATGYSARRAHPEARTA